MTRPAAHDARRAQLLAIGKRMFSARPFSAVAIEEIAAEAGISTGLLYHYFKNKRALYVAAVRSFGDDLVAAMVFPGDVPMPEAALTALQRFHAFIQENEALYRGVTRGGNADAEVHAILDDVRQQIIARLFLAAGLSPTNTRTFHFHGWLGYVESSSLHWLAERTLPHDTVIGLQLGALPHSMLDYPSGT